MGLGQFEQASDKIAGETDRESERIIRFTDELMDQARTHSFQNISKNVPGLKHFQIYMRCRTGIFSIAGMEVIVLANVASRDPGKGRFKLILESLKNHAADNSYILKIENVQNFRFRNFLIQGDFIFPGDWESYGSGYWCQEVEKLSDPSIQLPVW